VPSATIVYETLRQDVFHGRKPDDRLESVTMMDTFNRLYHARELNLKGRELRDLTVLEHDRNNQPTKSLYASRAVWTPHGWLLLYGTAYRVGPRGVLRGEPEPFVERLITYPVTPESFAQPQGRPEMMRYAQLRFLIIRLRQTGITVRRYVVELTSKLTLPLMNLVMGFLGFAGSIQLQQRGTLRGLGTSLAWGLLYYLGVAVGQGIGKEGFLGIPAVVAVWAPHGAALWWGLRVLRR